MTQCLIKTQRKLDFLPQRKHAATPLNNYSADALKEIIRVYSENRMKHVISVGIIVLSKLKQLVHRSNQWASSS
jgi:16S rRNA C1402 N4-methylase RsmH